MERTGFGDRVVNAVDVKRSVVCVGIDPRRELLPPECLEEAHRPGLSRAGVTAEAFRLFSERVVRLVAPHAAAVKPQVAFFEQYGSAGLVAYESVCRAAREAGVLIIADVKRGDIGTTAAAYAQAWLGTGGERAPLADACTVNPYLGTDGIEPFVHVGCDEGGGIFVLVKTSNPSSTEIQDLESGGRPIFEHAAELVARLNDPHVGVTGYGPVGAVVGATWPAQLKAIRKLLPASILLIPGYGAQGGRAEDVAPAFDADAQGALVSASRSLTFPWRGEGRCPTDWEERIVHEVQVMRTALNAVRGAGDA